MASSEPVSVRFGLYQNHHETLVLIPLASSIQSGMLPSVMGPIGFPALRGIGAEIYSLMYVCALVRTLLRILWMKDLFAPRIRQHSNLDMHHETYLGYLHQPSITHAVVGH